MTYLKSVSQEDVDRVISVMEEWFWAIERGDDRLRFPDPFGRRFTEEEVNKVIEGIDAYFNYQISIPDIWEETGMRTKNKPIDFPPDFNRLVGGAREAFVQQLKKAGEDGNRS